MPASIQQVHTLQFPQQGTQSVHTGAASGQSFESILESKLQTSTVEFSAHALDRIRQRNVQLTQDDLLKIDKAVSQAEAKGARDSLILLRDLAFVVNIQNKRVVTALSGDSARDNVFTNIDSAVLAS